MSAKLKNPAFSCRLVTAINQVINVLNAAIKQYCLPLLCPSCELSVVLITQRWRSRTILRAIRSCFMVICSILLSEVFKNVSTDERTRWFEIDN